MYKRLFILMLCTTIFIQCKPKNRSESTDNQHNTNLETVDAEVLEIEDLEDEIDSLNADIDSLLFILEEY